jgi:hypothetical protein
MMTDLEKYRQCGVKHALAISESNLAEARAQMEWFDRKSAREDADDALIAGRAYSEGFESIEHMLGENLRKKAKRQELADVV